VAGARLQFGRKKTIFQRKRVPNEDKHLGKHGSNPNGKRGSLQKRPPIKGFIGTLKRSSGRVCRDPRRYLPQERTWRNNNEPLGQTIRTETTQRRRRHTT